MGGIMAARRARNAETMAETRSGRIVFGTREIFDLRDSWHRGVSVRQIGWPVVSNLVQGASRSSSLSAPKRKRMCRAMEATIKRTWAAHMTFQHRTVWLCSANERIIKKLERSPPTMDAKHKIKAMMPSAPGARAPLYK
jgi:hypothetical protein